LRADVVAGAVVAALTVPQALGYASIAGAPVGGPYAVPVALVAYAIFGSSRQLVVGPVSTVSVLSGSLRPAFGPRAQPQARVVHQRLALGSGSSWSPRASSASAGWRVPLKPIVTGFVLGLTVLGHPR
jgi:hypothetical protein